MGGSDPQGQILAGGSRPTCPSLLVALGLLWASLGLHFICWEMRALTRKDLKVPETPGLTHLSSLALTDGVAFCAPPPTPGFCSAGAGT